MTVVRDAAVWVCRDGKTLRYQRYCVVGGPPALRANALWCG